MVKSISQFIALIFHPVFIVLYSYLIYFNINSIYNQMLYLAAPKYIGPFSFLGLMVIFFPFLTIYIMYKNKVVSSLAIPKREERIPVLILVIIYYSMVYIFRYWNTTLLTLEPFYLFYLGPNLLINSIPTLVKISIHSLPFLSWWGMIAETIVAQPGIGFVRIVGKCLITFYDWLSFLFQSISKSS